jgi:hypothetical protein
MASADPKTYGNRFFPQRIWRINMFSCFAILPNIFTSTNSRCDRGPNMCSCNVSPLLNGSHNILSTGKAWCYKHKNLVQT